MSLLDKKAPAFKLPDQDGRVYSLNDFAGNWLLLYFYPKDNTPGCTIEAKQFRDNLKQLTNLGVQVVGVSADSVASHKKFCEKQELNFPLLSDPEKTTLEAYGVWVEKSMYGKKYMGIQRDSFLIDSRGNVIKQYEKVNPKTHVDEVIKDVKELVV